MVKRKAQNLAVVLMALALVTVQIHPSSACTEFILKAQDGGFVIGRSLEFGWNPGYQAVVHPRGEQGSTDAPGGKPGLKWTSKYGFLAFEAFGSGVDGLNEAGLSLGALYLPGYTKRRRNIPPRPWPFWTFAPGCSVILKLPPR